MTQNAVFLAIAVLCGTCLYQCCCRSIEDSNAFLLDADNPLKDDEQDSLEDIDLRELAPHLRYGKEVAPHVRYGKEAGPNYGNRPNGEVGRQIGKDYDFHGHPRHARYGKDVKPKLLYRIPGKDFVVRGKLLSDLASGTQADDKAGHGRSMLALMRILRDVASESSNRKVS